MSFTFDDQFRRYIAFGLVALVGAIGIGDLAALGRASATYPSFALSADAPSADLRDELVRAKRNGQYVTIHKFDVGEKTYQCRPLALCTPGPRVVYDPAHPSTCRNADYARRLTPGELFGLFLLLVANLLGVAFLGYGIHWARSLAPRSHRR